MIRLKKKKAMVIKNLENLNEFNKNSLTLTSNNNSWLKETF